MIDTTFALEVTPQKLRDIAKELEIAASKAVPFQEVRFKVNHLVTLVYKPSKLTRRELYSYNENQERNLQ